MEFVNFFGMAFLAVIMIPNIVFAVKCKDGFANKVQNKGAERMEQIGRFGCFGFMAIQIPGTCFGWSSDEAFAIYLIVNTVLVLMYCIAWVILWKSRSLLRALMLSVLPSLVFLFSGLMTRSVLLLLSSLLFAPAHIWISYKNAQ